MQYLKSLLEEIQLPGISDKRIDSWINIKIDKDLALRISRYARSIDVYAEGTEIEDKLDILSRPRSNQYGVQCKLAIIILLQYLKEIKSNFNASVSGFLFENFIGGLLHLDNRDEDYGIVDLNDDKYRYQIKFYDNTHAMKFKEGCDYYIYGMKYEKMIRIWVLSAEEVKEILTTQKNVTIVRLMKNYIPYELKFSNIDKNISNISKELRSFIDDLYNEISDFNYNIETITTGVNKENQVVGRNQIDEYYNLASGNLKRISKNLEFVKRGIEKRVSKLRH